MTRISAFEDTLFATGINFHKSDVELRGKFSLDGSKSQQYLQEARQEGFEALLVLNTCNRCEIYGYGDQEKATDLLCRISGQERAVFEQYKLSKTGKDALAHVLNVASGLDSQIIGDNEILGQFKQACRNSKEAGLLGLFFERLANISVQAAKEIKTTTELNKGTTSVAYAAVDAIRHRFGNMPLKALLVGTGKFGAGVVKNLNTYCPEVELTIANRTQEKAMELASEKGLNWMPIKDVQANAGNFDVVILCAGKNTGYMVQQNDLANSRTKLVLDLAIPSGAEPSVADLPGVELLNIDSISSLLNDTLENRKSSLPDAEVIIAQHIAIFEEWYKVYRHRNSIQEAKAAMKAQSVQCPYLSRMAPEQLKKTMNMVINDMVKQIKNNEQIDFDIDKTVSYFRELNNQFVEKGT